MSRARRLRGVLVAATILFLLPVCAFAGKSSTDPFPRPSDTSSAAADCTEHVSDERQQAEHRILLLVNQQRQKQGIGELTASDFLAAAARQHSCRMMTLNFFDHVDPELGNPLQRMRSAGFHLKKMAENIAEQEGRLDPAGGAVQSWLGDAYHRQNLLDAGFGCTGVGVAIKRDGTYLVTEIFTPAPCPTPACNLTAEPRTVNPGETVTLNWSSPDGYQNTLSGIGAEPLTGSVTVTPEGTGVQKYELTAKGAAGTLVCMAEVEVKAPPLACKLTADPAHIEKADMDVKLTWEYPQGSKDVVLTRGLIEVQKLNNPSGSVTLKPSQTFTSKASPGPTVTFNVKGTGPDGKQFNCEAKVQVGPLPPKCTITASSKDKPGGPITLEWNAENADKAKLRVTVNPDDRKLQTPTGKQPEDVPIKGTKEVLAPSQKTTYTLLVNGKGGAGECSVTIATPTCSFKVRHVKDNEYRFNWSSAYAEKVEIKPEPGAVELKSPANGQSVKVDKSKRYTLTASGLAGASECRVTVCRPDGKDEKKLAIKQAYQTNFMWCWITCGQMIFDYYDVPSIAEAYIKNIKTNERVENWGFQCAIIAVAMPICGFGCENCKNTGGFYRDVIRMLDEYPKKVNEFIDKGWIQHAKVRPIGSTYVAKPLTPAEIRQEIDARPKGRPIIAGIKPNWAAELIKRLGKGEGASHVVLITGYEQVEGGGMCIRVNDPWRHEPANDPYLKLGGTKNSDGSYSIDYDSFKEGLEWVESFKGVAPK